MPGFPCFLFIPIIPEIFCSCLLIHLHAYIQSKSFNLFLLYWYTALIPSGVLFGTCFGTQLIWSVVCHSLVVYFMYFFRILPKLTRAVTSIQKTYPCPLDTGSSSQNIPDHVQPNPTIVGFGSRPGVCETRTGQA